MLKIEREVFFKPGCLNLIVGPTGSGKTSILMALLGEMHHVPNGPNSWFNLPRTGGVAYAAQESWVQNETIRVSFPTALSRLTRFNCCHHLPGQHFIWVSLRRRTLQQGHLSMRSGT